MKGVLKGEEGGWGEWSGFRNLERGELGNTGFAAAA